MYFGLKVKKRMFDGFTIIFNLQYLVFIYNQFSSSTKEKISHNY